MLYKIPKLNDKKTILICLSSGKYEKIYLGKVLENKNKIDYQNTDSEFNQLDKNHKNETNANIGIKKICKVIYKKLKDQYSFGDQNSNYLIVIITDCDKAPLNIYDRLKNAIKDEISKLKFNATDYYFVFSYKGFECWMQFYYNKNIHLENNPRCIKKKVKNDIKNKADTIFNNHKKAVENYYEMTKYIEPMNSYTTIENNKDIPYSDFPYLFKFLDEKYNTEILI